MEIIELLDFLEIESPEEFTHFEEFANLIECDKEISYEVLFELFSKVESENLTELIKGYFEDITENLPDDSLELFTVLSTISQVLTGFAGMPEEENGKNKFVDEFYRFKNWYTFGPMVHCTSIKSREVREFCVCEALYTFRLEKLNEENYFYDFDDCLDYEIEEYAMAFSAKIDLDGTDPYDGSKIDEDRYEEDTGGFDPILSKTEEDLSALLVDPINPVIDDEFEFELEDEMNDLD